MEKEEALPVFILFQKLFKRLEEVLKLEKSMVNKDASILRFRLTVELALKSIQKFLRSEGIICRSPKNCLEEAFKFGLIKDDARWFKILEDKNLIIHSYSEEIDGQVYDRLSQYLELFQGLKEKLAIINGEKF